MNINCILVYWINRLIISKGMSNIYLNSSYWEKLTFSKLRFSKFKTFVFRSVFDELQLTQISLNFKTSWCNLKIRSLEKKNHVKLFSTYVSFLVSSCEKTLFNITHNIAGPPHALPLWEDKNFSKRGNLKAVWSNLM